MTELQYTAGTYQLYEGLIDRLALALEIASTAVRLRDESPVELELKGLSRAEFELIEAYLEKDARAANGVFKDKRKGGSSDALQRSGLASTPRQSATIVWLKDKQRAKAPTRTSRRR